MVSLGQGVKECVLTGQDFMGTSEWWSVISYSPKVNLERYVRELAGEESENVHNNMFHHFIFCGQGTRDPKGTSADNLSAASRLAIALRVIYLTMPDIEGSGYLSDIFRYLFTWPALCTNGFVQQVKEENMASLTMLFYYYSAILAVYSERIWWMRDRAIFMWRALNEKLKGRCERCTAPARHLYNGGKLRSSSSTREDKYRSSEPEYSMNKIMGFKVYSHFTVGCPPKPIEKQDIKASDYWGYTPDMHRRTDQ
jgi:hypothetical protein